jgi:hypothetical protein
MFYSHSAHGQKILEELAAGVGTGGPADALVLQNYALSFPRMLMLVCNRQLRLALRQGPMIRIRMSQVWL